jgi:hypothetical protein
VQVWAYVTDVQREQESSCLRGSVESHKAPVSLRTRPRAQDSKSRAKTLDLAVELDNSIARLVGP